LFFESNQVFIEGNEISKTLILFTKKLRTCLFLRDVLSFCVVNKTLSSPLPLSSLPHKDNCAFSNMNASSGQRMLMIVMLAMLTNKLVNGYSSAPVGTPAICAKFYHEPPHGTYSGTDGGYVVSGGASDFTVGGAEYQVAVFAPTMGGPTFKGIALSARDQATGLLRGTWNVGATNPLGFNGFRLECPTAGDNIQRTITHATAEVKGSTSCGPFLCTQFFWTPPPIAFAGSIGPISFRVVLVDDYNTFHRTGFGNIVETLPSDNFTIYGRPDPPTNFSLVERRFQTTRLQWREPLVFGQPGFEIVGFEIQQSPDDSHTAFATVFNNLLGFQPNATGDPLLRWATVFNSLPQANMQYRIRTVTQNLVGPKDILVSDWSSILTVDFDSRCLDTT
jgi:hypothetical protein